MDKRRINDYIDYTIDETDDGLFYYFYLDDRFSWHHSTDNVFEFAAIVYKSKFKDLDDVKNIDITEANRKLCFEDRRYIDDFYYWASGGNRIYMNTYVPFKNVLKELKHYDDEVIEMMKTAKNVGDIFDFLDKNYESLLMQAVKIISYQESEDEEKENEDEESNN